ncbi:MAG: asparaginase, partial [Cyanobacteria bacterium]|nr:asparaginase [Cyanobacteriota bacterium]
MTETMMLAQVVRGDYPENRFYGWFTVTNHCGNILYSTPGANEISTFFRSAAKPFQFLPSLKANLTQNLEPEEIAIACSSHVGSPIHQHWAEHLLSRVNLTSHHLHCGADIPLDRETEVELIRSSNAPNPLHNNCSGKHAAMLYYCHHQNYPLDSYLEPNHPLQQEIIKTLQELTQQPQIPTAIDGCGAPVFYLPLKAMATLYGLFGSDHAFLPIQNAMTQFPELISGKGRIDTVLMEVTQGKLL